LVTISPIKTTYLPLLSSTVKHSYLYDPPIKTFFYQSLGIMAQLFQKSYSPIARHNSSNVFKRFYNFFPITLALVFSPTPGKLSYTNTFLNFVLLFHPNSFILILSNHLAQLKKKIKSLDKNPSLYGFSHLMHLTQESLENTLYYKPLVMNFLSLRTNTQHKFCQNPFSKHEHLTQLGLFHLVEALSLA
jgi:hypothetical protein